MSLFGWSYCKCLELQTVGYAYYFIISISRVEIMEAENHVDIPEIVTMLFS